MAQLAKTVIAERVVVAETIDTLSVTVDGTASQHFLEIVHRLADGSANESDRTAIERAMLAGGSSHRLAFPNASVVVEGKIGTFNQTMQLVEAGALTAALAAHQSKISADRFKSSLQAYMQGL